MSASLETVVVRQLAGLRRANWSLGEALEFVQAELPSSTVKTRLEGALASLRAGVSEPSSDLLVATLTRGDAASAPVLEQLADALEAEAQARVSTTMVRAAVTLVLCVCTLVVMRFTGSFISSFSRLFEDFGAALPAPTQLFIDVSGPMRVAAPVMLVVALFVVWRARFDGVTGARELRASSLLLQFASAVDAGVAEQGALALVDPKAQQLQTSAALRLDSTEQVFLHQATASSGSADAARRLALELRAQGGRLAAEGRWWTSPGLILVVLFTALFVSGALIAMYLPIFSISAAIK
ncbi:MAG: hypothetical protein Q8S33_18780 [Myxococcales bacterium]|nr:hypothetical protein [Myxococcales bacterium]